MTLNIETVVALVATFYIFGVISGVLLVPPVADFLRSELRRGRGG